MSESNRTLEDFSLQLQEAYCHILNEINLSKSLDLDNYNVAIGGLTNIYSYNRNYREGKNDEHEGESQVDSLPVSDTRDIVDDAEQKFADKSVVINRRIQYADKIKRNCPKCKMTVVDAKIAIKQLCNKCETPLSYQCAQCNKQYNCYRSLTQHLYSCLSEIIYNCSRCKYTSLNKFRFYNHMRKRHNDISNANCMRKQHAGLIKRNCPKCNMTVADAKVTIKLLCNECGTLLNYQCDRCNNEYNNYGTLLDHLYAKCNPRNQNLKCPNCDYRCHSRKLMSEHLSHCSSEIIFKCGLCKYTTKSRTNLSEHVTTVHRDILQLGCSECKTKPYKCAQCKTVVQVSAQIMDFRSTQNFANSQY